MLIACTEDVARHVIITAPSRMYTDSHLAWLAKRAAAFLDWQVLEQLYLSCTAYEKRFSMHTPLPAYASSLFLTCHEVKITC